MTKNLTIQEFSDAYSAGKALQFDIRSVENLVDYFSVLMYFENRAAIYRGKINFQNGEHFFIHQQDLTLGEADKLKKLLHHSNRLTPEKVYVLGHQRC